MPLYRIILFLAFLGTALSACTAQADLSGKGSVPFTFAASLTQTVTITPSATSTPTPMPTATITPTPKPLPTKEGWRLLFSEEFDNPQLNTSIWHPQNRWGSVNPPEKEHYTPDALEIRDGQLIITARKQKLEGYPYTSGIIASYGNLSFQYGYVEMRAKVPAGKGLWPAFWMLASNPKSGNEIDIMEILGHQPTRVNMTIHYDNPGSKSDSIGGEYDGPDFSAGWHTFAVDWSPSLVIWYVDGQERYRQDQHVPQEPVFLVANLAVGGAWPGNPNDSTQFPAEMAIDYIRVFQR